MFTPDALAELLLPVAPSVLHLSADFPDKTPIFHLMQLPGVPSNQSWERIDHVQIDIYAEGFDPAKDLTQSADEILQGWAQTSFGKIDKIRAEVPFSHEPIAHDTLNKFSGTFLVTYRI